LYHRRRRRTRRRTRGGRGRRSSSSSSSRSFHELSRKITLRGEEVVEHFFPRFEKEIFIIIIGIGIRMSSISTIHYY
jgi:hypothetical protein